MTGEKQRGVSARNSNACDQKSCPITALEKSIVRVQVRAPAPLISFCLQHFQIREPAYAHVSKKRGGFSRPGNRDREEYRPSCPINPPRVRQTGRSTPVGTG